MPHEHDIILIQVNMALLDFFKTKHDTAPNVMPVLPEEIYKTGVLNLQDVIAPHRTNRRNRLPRSGFTASMINIDAR